MSSTLLGLGVELDMKFKAKWLVNHLSKLGFSTTSDNEMWMQFNVMPRTTVWEYLQRAVSHALERLI